MLTAQKRNFSEKKAPAGTLTAQKRYFPEKKTPAGMQTTKNIVKNEGVTALWRGATPAIARILPYSATTFGTYNIYNKFFIKAMYDELLDMMGGDST